MSAYPDGLVEVLDFKYSSDLLLTRRIEKVQTRTGVDTKYVVARDYRAFVKIRRYGSRTANWFPIRVPRRFLTNLSSVPSVFRIWISRVGPHLEASIVHDWLYSAWQIENVRPTETQRHFADQVFLAAMRKAKVNGLKCRAIFLAVHYGGGFSFEHEVSPLFADSRPSGGRSCFRHRGLLCRPCRRCRYCAAAFRG